MARIEVLERLTGIFRDIFDDESLELHEDTTSEDIDGWDSLSQITILSAIEDEFNVKLNIKSAMTQPDVSALIDMILR